MASSASVVIILILTDIHNHQSYNVTWYAPQNHIGCVVAHGEIQFTEVPYYYFLLAKTMHLI